MLRGLTLIEPWAKLIEIGVKGIETRSWKCPDDVIGTRILVHTSLQRVEHKLRLGQDTPYVTQEYLTERRGGRGQGAHHVADVLLDLCNEEAYPLRYGVITGSVEVAACLPMLCMPPGLRFIDELAEIPFDALIVGAGVLWVKIGGEFAEAARELPYGDYRPGRFGWLLSGYRPTFEMCPWCDGTGREGAWESCQVCEGMGACPPIRAKGSLGLWRWKP